MSIPKIDYPVTHIPEPSSASAAVDTFTIKDFGGWVIARHVLRHDAITIVQNLNDYLSGRSNYSTKVEGENESKSDSPILDFHDWYAANALRIAEDATERDWAWEGWNAAVKAASYVVGLEPNLLPESEAELAIERTRRDLEDLVRERLTAE